MADLEQAHSYGACSTLILYSFWYTDNQPGAIEKYLRKKIKDGEIECRIDDCDYPVSQYAFIVASTDTRGNEGVEKQLRELGFKETEETYNEKNDTHVRFWMIEIPKLVERFKE